MEKNKIHQTHSKVKEDISLSRLKQIAKKFPNDNELGAHIRHNLLRDVI